MSSPEDARSKRVQPPAADAGTGPEDLLLVRRVLRSADEQAVGALLGRLSCVPRFVYRLNRSLGYGLGASQLEDVVQQVYLAIWPRLGDFDGSASLSSWVYGFCRNCTRAAARRRAAAPAAVHGIEVSTGEDGMPERGVVRRERADAVCDELSRLPQAEREVVLLRHLEEWSFERIARHQSVAASTVKDRCYRAVQKLRGRLERRDVQ